MEKELGLLQVEGWSFLPLASCVVIIVPLTCLAQLLFSGQCGTGSVMRSAVLRWSPCPANLQTLAWGK